jgi:hypothetical protein
MTMMDKKKKKKPTPIARGRKPTGDKPTHARLVRNRPPDKEDPPGSEAPPLDPAADFKDEQSPAAEAGSLLAEQPPKPTVVGKRIQMHFLKPSFSKTTKGERLLALHMSFALTEEHTADDLLPEEIREGWKIMSKRGRKRFDIEVSGQKAVFHLTSDGEPKLTLPAAKMVDVSIAVVQKKGDGQTETVIRLSFRLQVRVTHDVAEFAELNFGNSFWLTLEDTDEDLFDEEEEE